MKPGAVFFPVLTFFGLIVGGLSIFLLIIPFISIFEGLLEPRFSNEPFYILVLGLDDLEDSGSGRTDAINVIGFSPTERRIGVLPIPRDLMLEIQTAQGSQKTRINALYRSHGLEFLIQQVETLLDLSIERSIILNYELFQYLGDQYGPIPIDVASPMRYYDTQQKLEINFPAGRIMMSGLDLLKYIRFRDDSMGDLGRIQRQKEVVQRLLEAMKQKTNLFMLPTIYTNIRKQILWDIDLNDLIYLYIHFREQFDIVFLSFPYLIMANGELVIHPQRTNDLHYQLSTLQVPIQITRPQVLIVNGYSDSAFSFSVTIDNAWRTLSEISYTMIPQKIQAKSVDDWLAHQDTLIFLTQDPVKRQEIRQTLERIHPSNRFQEIYPLPASGLEEYYHFLNLLHDHGYFYGFPLDGIIYLAHPVH